MADKKPKNNALRRLRTQITIKSKVKKLRTKLKTQRNLRGRRKT
jgi:hypothetical protein